jgi:uncharacterized membrane protein
MAGSCFRHPHPDLMNTTVAPAPWSRPVVAPASAWHFGTEVLGVPGDEQGASRRIEWRLKRNCSISPKQLFGVYVSLCVVSLVIAGAFSWAGASPVLMFAGVELLLVGAALLVYARHAADQERITLAGAALTVEHLHGGETERSEFRAAWVRVEPLSSDRSLIEVAGDGQTVRVGRYVRPELRASLARELRVALRGQGAAPSKP